MVYKLVSSWVATLSNHKLLIASEIYTRYSMYSIISALLLSGWILSPTLVISLNITDSHKQNDVSGTLDVPVESVPKTAIDPLSSVPRTDTSYVSNIRVNTSRISRGFSYLTPGQEFLLSVASFEDTKGPAWENLPHLMNLLQNGKLDVKRVSGQNKKGLPTFLMRMVEGMKVKTAIEKADEDESDTGVSIPTGFLDKLAGDPMTIILAAIIPFSLLLAAVLPLLVNQFAYGLYIPSVTTTATGYDRTTEERQFVENIIESMASVGSQMSEEVTKEKTKSERFNALKGVLQLLTRFINESWMGRFASTSVQRLRSCKDSDCEATK